MLQGARVLHGAHTARNTLQRNSSSDILYVAIFSQSIMLSNFANGAQSQNV